MAKTNANTTHTPPAPGQCYAIPTREGRWGACQVLALDGDQVEVLALDLWSKRRPSLATLAGARGLVIDHHSHRGDLLRWFVSGLPPADYRVLGTLEPLVSLAAPCTSYSSWEGLALQIHRQQWWQRSVPPAEKRRYRACAGPGLVRVDLGPGPELRRSASEVSIGPHEHADIHLEPGERVNWAALDVLGQLTRLEYRGRDAQVLDYVRSRRLLTTLTWTEHRREGIDLRDAGLHDFRTRPGRKLALQLDAELEQLVLYGHQKGRAVQVTHPRESQGLRLCQRGCAEVPPFVRGADRLSELELDQPRRVDLRRVAKYRELRALTLRGSFAALEHPEALAKLQHLSALTLYDCYELPVAGFPELGRLPKLRRVEFSGLRKSDAKALRARWAALPQLEIRGAKNDAWIAANVDNPLRDWVDDDERFGEQACKAYAKAHRSVTQAGTRAEARRALVDFVRALNRVDARHGLIDTLRREQALEAFEALAALTELPGDEAFACFDAEREF